MLLIVVLTLGSLGAFFGFVALPPAFHDLRDFVRELPQRGPQFFARIQQIPVLRDINLDALQEKLQDVASNLAAYAVSFASDWAGTGGSHYRGDRADGVLHFEGDEAYGWFLSLFPMERRLRLDQTLARASARMGRWLLGQGTLMSILGVCSTIVFALLRIQLRLRAGRDHGPVQPRAGGGSADLDVRGGAGGGAGFLGTRGGRADLLISFICRWRIPG